MKTSGGGFPRGKEEKPLRTGKQQSAWLAAGARTQVKREARKAEDGGRGGKNAAGRGAEKI